MQIWKEKVYRFQAKTLLLNVYIYFYINLDSQNSPEKSQFHINSNDSKENQIKIDGFHK